MRMNKADEELVFFLPEVEFRDAVMRRFETLEREIRSLLPDAEIQHVGSTAIPGSLTNGDLDVQVRVDAGIYPTAKWKLSQIYGLNLGGFAAGDAISFEGYSGAPSVGIHLTVIGGSADIQWKFRDRLVESECLRQAYDSLKREFQGKSMSSHRAAKERFVIRVLSDDSAA